MHSAVNSYVPDVSKFSTARSVSMVKIVAVENQQKKTFLRRRVDGTLLFWGKKRQSKLVESAMFRTFSKVVAVQIN